jgi:drug/metabolite transporter (DMT)-like permease
VWSALGAVYVIWGATYLAIRVMVEDIPPLLGAGLRFLVAGGVLLAVLGARGAPATSPRVPLAQVAAAAVVGLLLPAGGNGLVTVAERNVPSGLAALLIASVPLWVVVLRAGIARERVGTPTLAGVVLGFSGVAILLLPGARPEGATTGGVLLVLLAALSWATGTFLSPRLTLPAHPLVNTGWQMLAGGVALTVAGLAAGETGQVHLGALSAGAIAAFLYLIFVGSIVAYTAYAWLLQHVSLSLVSTYAYVNPLVAVLLGWAILGESLAAASLAGAALIVAAVALIVSRQSR